MRGRLSEHAPRADSLPVRKLCSFAPVRGRGPMTEVARIALPVPLRRGFDYAVPEDVPIPAKGARVRVRFNNRMLIGLCVGLNPPDVHPNPIPLLDVLDPVGVLTDEALALAHWLAGYYHHPLGEVCAAMLPRLVMKGAPLCRPRRAVWRLRAGDLPDLKRAPKQRALVEFFKGRGGWSSAADIRAAGFTSNMIAALAAKDAIEPGERTYELEEPPTLNAEQRAIVEGFKSESPGFATTLIDGVTGSGKTEVYLQVMAEVLERGQQVLVLVPEIALTPQTVGRFRRRYGETSVLHSGLGDRERLEAWLKCRDGATRILIGTRSAVLTPFRNLGLIVVDEEHDSSFKQQDGLRYCARDVAVKRAQTLDIPLLLGSATPALESLRNARVGRYRHQRLTQRATGAPMPPLHVLDIRGHPLREGLSEPLAKRIERHLRSGTQVLVFLNRRGYAPVYLCTGCGWQARCDACDARLTLHRVRASLNCHHCGAKAPVPTQCPSCAAPRLLALGAGTQRVEAGLRERFPDYPLYRIDRDTTRSQRRLEEQLGRIQQGGPAILVGTQMLAKGHHFPNVTLVAALNADAGFLSADFKAAERTAQLIIQVAGRAGRAERPGEVWIQSLQPDSPALRQLVGAGYAGFAEQELAIRERAGLPPSRPMALVRAEAEDGTAARTFLEELKPRLPRTLEVFGPAPAPMMRLANRYRFQLMLLAESRRALHGGLGRIADSSAPRNLRWAIDVDPADAF